MYDMQLTIIESVGVDRNLEIADDITNEMIFSAI